MTETFWQRKRKEGQAGPARNGAEDIGVWVHESEAAPGEYHWEIARVDVLSPEENGGNHNVFIDAVRDGNVVRGLVVEWGWDGMTPSQKRDIDRQPLYLNKQVWEFGCDIAPHAGQVIWGRIKGQPSETFGGFDIRRSGPGGGLSWGHWSIYVLFRWKQKEGVPQVPVDPPVVEPEEPLPEPPTRPVQLEVFLRRANVIVARHVQQIFEELIQAARANE